MGQKVVICGVNTSSLPLLTEEESTALMRRVKAGDEAAREQFIVGNMRLVLSVIKRFWAKKVNADDLFQAGCIGLIKSIDHFDLSVGVKFSTYAVPMIIGEIKRFLRGVNSLRVSRSIRDTAYQVLKTRGELERRDEEVSVDKIAAAMNVAVSEVVYALDAALDGSDRRRAQHGGKLDGKSRPGDCDRRTLRPGKAHFVSALLRGAHPDGDLRRGGHLSGAGFPPGEERAENHPRADGGVIFLVLAA